MAPIKRGARGQYFAGVCRQLSCHRQQQQGLPFQANLVTHRWEVPWRILRRAENMSKGKKLLKQVQSAAAAALQKAQGPVKYKKVRLVLMGLLGKHGVLRTV